MSLRTASLIEGGVAMAALSGNDRPELLAMHIDAQGGNGLAYYRALLDLMPSGIAARWSIAG
jgi:hypothetical protein